MRNLLTSLLLACLSFVAEAGEVTTTYEVALNGQQFLVEANVATNVLVEGREWKLSVREKPERTFNDGDISFAFPSTHALTKEVDSGITTWTLDGEDSVLILIKLKGSDASGVANETVKSLLKKYGAKSKQLNCQVMIGRETLSGKKVTALLVGETITQEVYAMKAGPNGYVLIIQNSGETESNESRKVKALLKDTFKRATFSNEKPAK